jgi:hypothetical protein
VIVVDEALAATIGGKHMSRVRGTINGTEFRSNLAKMGGALYLGAHKATVQAANLAIGEAAHVEMSLDTAPREGPGRR